MPGFAIVTSSFWVLAGVPEAAGTPAHGQCRGHGLVGVGGPDACIANHEIGGWLGGSTGGGSVLQADSKTVHRVREVRDSQCVVLYKLHQCTV